MKTSVLGMGLLFMLSSAAFADEQPSLEDQCRAIAQSHGIAADKLDAWMTKCKERTMDMQHKMDEKNKAHDMEGMGGMGHDNMGEMHGKPKEEGK